MLYKFQTQFNFTVRFQDGLSEVQAASAGGM